MPTVPTQTMNNKKSMGDNVLRGLFVLALAWALLFWFGEFIMSLNPIPEGSNLHMVMEHGVPPIIAVVVASILLALIVKLKPRFLSVPKQVTALRLWSTLFVTIVITGIVIPLIVLAAIIILVPPTPHPKNPQDIPLVVSLAPFVYITLLPAASILITWMWIILRRPVAA